MKRYCNRCGKQVKKETEKTKDNYPYYCPNCDENMFEFETHTKKRSYVCACK